MPYVTITFYPINSKLFLTFTSFFFFPLRFGVTTKSFSINSSSKLFGRPLTFAGLPIKNLTKSKVNPMFRFIFPCLSFLHPFYVPVFIKLPPIFYVLFCISSGCFQIIKFNRILFLFSICF